MTMQAQIYNSTQVDISYPHMCSYFYSNPPSRKQEFNIIRLTWLTLLTSLKYFQEAQISLSQLSLQIQPQPQPHHQHHTNLHQSSSSSYILIVLHQIMGCFSFFFKRRADPPKHFPEFKDELSDVQNLKLYLYKELRIATDGFSPANKIGEGGFGPVYWGRLKHGKYVAIKVLSAESKQGAREFLTEIKVIYKIQHENLAKLCGCCVEGDNRILVYEYIENNSLAQTLLGGGHSSIQFSWKTRTKICIGIAKGLAYLHEEVKPHIVHRDIKASNILLDKDLTPKISDFGLAKLIPANMTHVSTRVAGTIGYLAPEYAIRGHLTRKADVYSFGVLLIEIVSGRCNTNSLLPLEEQFILERAWDLYERNELVELVDTSMHGDFDAEQAFKYLKIGLLCTQDITKLRPMMSTVVKMLSGQINVDKYTITKPGLISDFMDLKIRSNPNKTACSCANQDPKKITFTTISSCSDNAEHSLSSSNTSPLTMTYTDTWDQTP